MKVQETSTFFGCLQAFGRWRSVTLVLERPAVESDYDFRDVLSCKRLGPLT